MLCPKLLLVCKFCEQDVPASEMSEHESLCGDSLRECPRCAEEEEADGGDRWVALRDWERHLANWHGLLVQRSPGRQRKQSSTQGWVWCCSSCNTNGFFFFSNFFPPQFQLCPP